MAQRKAMIKNIGVIALILLTGIFIGYLFAPKDNSDHEHDHTSELDANGTTVWTCSMHPQIKMNEPGQCPLCGMALIPLDEESADDQPFAVRLSENAMKLANVQSIVVGKGGVSKSIRLNGKVAVDERRVYAQSSHIPGRVEKLTVNFTGESINRGQLLATVYSPDLISAQQELLYASNNKDRQPALYQAAQEKLRNWKISQKQIDNIIANGKPLESFPLYADISGVVTKKNVSLGDYLERGTILYEIADLQKVWILFDLYEIDLQWVKIGSKVNFTVTSYPGKTFSGNVSFIDAVINPTTRVVSARVEADNAAGLLKPEMFVTGEVVAGMDNHTDKSMSLPKSAIMWTGERSVIYVKDQQSDINSFEMREVTLGPSVGNAYVVLDGLSAGEEVVVNGTFTIDAAAQLAGKPSMMNRETETKKENAPMAKIDIDQKTKDKLKPLFASYFEVKDHLAGDNLPQSMKSANDFQSLVNKIDAKAFNPEFRSIWMDTKNKLVQMTGQLEKNEDIKSMRVMFQQISNTMLILAQTTGSLGEPLYVQHCPMAFGNKGADWLSLKEEIENPYYGATMFRCGEVTQVIK